MGQRPTKQCVVVVHFANAVTGLDVSGVVFPYAQALPQSMPNALQSAESKDTVDSVPRVVSFTGGVVPQWGRTSGTGHCKSQSDCQAGVVQRSRRAGLHSKAGLQRGGLLSARNKCGLVWAPRHPGQKCGCPRAAKGATLLLVRAAQVEVAWESHVLVCTARWGTVENWVCGCGLCCGVAIGRLCRAVHIGHPQSHEGASAPLM